MPTTIRPVVHPLPVIQKTAATGIPLILDSASSVDAGCHSTGVPTARLSQPPAHGTVRLLHQDVYPTFPTTNPRFECNSVKVPGIMAEYVSAPGFTGSDFTAIDVIFPDGKEGELKFAITVK